MNEKQVWGRGGGKNKLPPPSPNPSVGPAPVARAAGRDSAERGYPEQKIRKSLVGVLSQGAARAADGAGGWGRAGEGLRVTAAVVLHPWGPGGGRGCCAEPRKGEERACLWLCLEAGLGCCRGKNS